MAASLSRPGIEEGRCRGDAARMRTVRWMLREIHSDRVFTLVFPLSVSAVPGQFLNLWVPGVDEKPFSISDHREGVVEVTIRKVGPCSNALASLETTQWLGVRGPFGRGFRSLRPPVLVVAGGMGAAPLHFLARELRHKEQEFVLLAGARTEGDHVFRRGFEELGARFATDDGSLGHRGLVTDLVADALSQTRFGTICACGPEPMLLAVRDLAEQHRTPYQLAFERYMKCGIGICGQCCLDGSGIRLCREGPVLTQRQLKGITELGLPHRDAAGQRKTA